MIGGCGLEVGRGQRWVGHGGWFICTRRSLEMRWVAGESPDSQRSLPECPYTQLSTHPHLRPSPLSPSRKSTVSTMCSSILGPATCGGEEGGIRERGC